MKKSLKIAITGLAVTAVAQSAENNNQRINPLEQSICMDENFRPISERDMDRLMAQTKADYEDLEMQKILDQSRKDHEQHEEKKAIELSLEKKEKKDRQEIYQQIEMHEINEQLELYHLAELFENEEKQKQIESDELMAFGFLDQSSFFPLELQDHGLFKQNSTATNSAVHTNKDILNSTKAPQLDDSVNIEAIYADAGLFLQSLRNNIIAEKGEYGIYSKTLEDIEHYTEILKELRGDQAHISEQLNNNNHDPLALLQEQHTTNENIKDTEKLLKNLNDLKDSPELIMAAEEIEKGFNNIKVKAISEKFNISYKKAQDILDIFGL